MCGNHVVRHLRSDLGLTVERFAEEAGLSRVYVSQVEAGTYRLGRDAALAILDAYRRELAERRLTLEDLLRGEVRRA